MNVALTFKEPVEIFGRDAQAPSSLHSIHCDEVAYGLTCVLTKVGVNPSFTPYRILLATNTSTPPDVRTADKGIALTTLDTVKNRIWWPISYLLFWGLMVAIFVPAFAWLYERQFRQFLQGHVAEVSGEVTRLRKELLDYEMKEERARDEEWKKRMDDLEAMAKKAGLNEREDS